MEHTEWLQTISPDSVRATAIKAGIKQRTLASQLEKNSISAENVIAIAEAYDHHPVGALVDTNYLHKKWAQQVDPTRAIRNVTDEALTDEILRRLGLGTLPDDITHTPADELAARRKTQHDSPPTNVDDMPEDAVAYGHDLIGGTADDFES